MWFCFRAIEKFMKAFVVYEGFCMVRNIYTMVLLIWFATRLFVCYVEVLASFGAHKS